jgi:hypothetical protein
VLSDEDLTQLEWWANPSTCLARVPVVLEAAHDGTWIAFHSPELDVETQDSLRGDHPFFRTSRRRLITLAILAAVVAFGWYAAQPVYPACTVYSGAHLPVNASAAGVDAAARQAYEKALADGAT